MLGGTLIEPPFDLAEDGRRAVVADPVGARLAPWQSGARYGAEVVNEIGCWCSDQLPAPDPAPASRSIATCSNEVEPEGDSYWAIRSAGADNGGILAEPGPAAWLVYFHVAVADAAVQTVISAGGTVLFPPTTVDIGRIAVVTDPQGAAFGVFEGETDP